MFNEQSKERIKQLCESITKEQDQRRFSLLIAELDQLLEKLQPTRTGSADSAAPTSSVPEDSLPDPEG